MIRIKCTLFRYLNLLQEKGEDTVGNNRSSFSLITVILRDQFNFKNEAKLKLNLFFKKKIYSHSPEFCKRTLRREEMGKTHFIVRG